MSDNACKKRRGKKDAAVAARTTANHKKRRVAKDARRQSRDASLRPRRLMLRKLGAVRRLERRMSDPSDKSGPALMNSLAKAKAAFEAAKKAA